MAIFPHCEDQSFVLRPWGLTHGEPQFSLNSRCRLAVQGVVEDLLLQHLAANPLQHQVRYYESLRLSRRGAADGELNQQQLTDTRSALILAYHSAVAVPYILSAYSELLCW